MAKRLDDTEALSTQAANDPSEIEKIIQEQEKLKQKKRAYSDFSKRLKENEALSTRAMKELSEKQKIIQEQTKLIDWR